MHYLPTLLPSFSFTIKKYFASEDTSCYFISDWFGCENHLRHLLCALPLVGYCLFYLFIFVKHVPALVEV